MCKRLLQCALVVTMLLVETPVPQVTTAVHLPGLTVSLAAQSLPPVPVSVEPPGPVEIVLFSAGTAGKRLTTTDRDGRGSIDGGAIANLGRLDVLEETCGSHIRVLLVASNAKVPNAGQCGRRSIGSFVSGKDRALKAELLSVPLAPLPRAAIIPDPPPASPPVAAAQRAESAAQKQPVLPSAVSGGVGTCPPGAGMVGPKLNLPPGGTTFEEAPLLSQCVFKGLQDVEKGWQYYKLSVENGQTLKVAARTRDSGIQHNLDVRLHGPKGGQVEAGYISTGSTILEMEYKAAESGFAYVAVSGSVRDAAFEFAID